MLYDGFEAIIGLECHAQLRTRSKMFCPCPLPADGATENSHICPICMAHPGTLPALNNTAVALGVRAGLALSCTVHPVSIFSRKNYFYPDLPKGYQISQYDRPLCTGGQLHTALGTFGITRIHLEEDAGKMLHEGDRSVVDWNRAGVPLIEIVSEAHMRSPEQAEAYMRGLHRVLVSSGICGGDLEKGQMRCDANISVHRPGEPWGTKVEVKNVNSFRFVAKAIRYEIDRQIQAIKNGEAIFQETRTWAGNRTVLLRKKEGSADYRYFPEPDLGPLVLTDADMEAAAAGLPGMPMDLYLQAQDQAKKDAWIQSYGLTAADVGVLQGEADVGAFFEETVRLGAPPKAMANLVMSEILRRWNAEGIGQLTPAMLVEVYRLIEGGAVNRDGARQILDRLVAEGGQAASWAEKLGLKQLSDEGALQKVVEELLEKHASERDRYRAGNKGLMGFFVGELMKATQRRADPKLSATLLRAALDGTTAAPEKTG